mmetsp:Transcript_30677/g.27142  ORF Transcript_30677/g.27142 Transcript_30677/m.27142 type:complete len:112 (-) Transcript_30677:44-379(-)
MDLSGYFSFDQEDNNKRVTSDDRRYLNQRQPIKETKKDNYLMLKKRRLYLPTTNEPNPKRVFNRKARNKRATKIMANHDLVLNNQYTFHTNSLLTNGRKHYRYPSYTGNSN